MLALEIAQLMSVKFPTEVQKEDTSISKEALFDGGKF